MGAPTALGPLLMSTVPDWPTFRGSGMCIVVASFAMLDQLVVVLATGSMTTVRVLLRPPLPVIVVVSTVLPSESRASVAVDSRVIVVPSASF